MTPSDPWLAKPGETVKVLKEHNFFFKKRYGQNFLTDPHVIEKIISAADLCGDDFVIEIGSGIGTLTQYLACGAGKVAAVEIDQHLIPILAETLGSYANVTVFCMDILKADIPKLIREESEGRRLKIVANLPYYITTPVIMKLLEEGIPFERATLMMQKEVGRRIIAQPGTPDYGAITPVIRYYAEVETVANVPPNCFIPRPDISSIVLNLTRRKERPAVRDEKLLMDLIHAAFSMRRKTLVNCLVKSAPLQLDRKEWVAMIEDTGLRADVRGETLGLLEFIALADRIFLTAQCE